MQENKWKVCYKKEVALVFGCHELNILGAWIMHSLGICNYMAWQNFESGKILLEVKESFISFNHYETHICGCYHKFIWQNGS